MKIKKIISISVITVLCLIVAVAAVFINAITGNPVSKAIAKNRVAAYCKTVYDSETEIHMQNYDPITSKYYANCRIGEMDVIFPVFGNRMEDPQVSNYYNELLDSYIQNLSASLPEKCKVSSFDMTTEIILNGKYAKTPEELKKSQTLHLHLSIKRKDIVYEEFVYQILTELNSQGFQIDSFQIFVLGANKSYHYNAENMKDITVEKIAKSAK